MEARLHGLGVGNALGVGAAYKTLDLTGKGYLALLRDLVVTDDIQVNLWSE